MGEVYQEKDQKLGRDVAIKVLPEEFANNADRISRFVREAKILASLNHANIAEGWERSAAIFNFAPGNLRLLKLLIRSIIRSCKQPFLKDAAYFTYKPTVSSK